MTGSGSTLDTFKVTQYNRTFPRVYYSKEGYVVVVVVVGRGGISRCRSSLQMSKYAVNHSEDLRALKRFLTESVSQPSGPRMTKTLMGVFRLVAAAGAAAATLDHPLPNPPHHPHNSSPHNPKAVQTERAKPKWPPFRRCPTGRFV